LRNIEGLADKRLHPDDVSKILKEDLNLRYLRYNSAMVRYQDPTFDEKRLWVSRIMA